MVWKLPLRATRTLWATLCWVRPMSWARVRSTSTVNLGRSNGCWMRVSAAPANILHIVEQLLGAGAIAVEIGADDLDIDGRRRGRS